MKEVKEVKEVEALLDACPSGVCALRDRTAVAIADGRHRRQRPVDSVQPLPDACRSQDAARTQRSFWCARVTCKRCARAWTQPGRSGHSGVQE